MTFLSKSFHTLGQHEKLSQSDGDDRRSTLDTTSYNGGAVGPAAFDAIEDDTGSSKSPSRPWWKHIILELFALLWVIPMIALLVMNFRGYIIGASACECLFA